MASGDSPSSIFLRNRFLKCGLYPKKSYQMSSVWLGLRKQWGLILQKARWVIGNGDKVHFWMDNWVGTLLMDFCGIHVSLKPILLDLVSDFYCG